MLKKSLIIFISEVLIFWILWFVYGFVWVQGNTGLSQILKILSYGIMGLAIATAIITFVIILHESAKGTKAIHEIVFVIFIIVHLGLYLLFSDIGKIKGDSFTIIDKASENGEYFIYIEEEDEVSNIKIFLRYEDYQKIDLDNETEYTFSYRWLKIIPGQGYMEKGSLMNGVETN